MAVECFAPVSSSEVTCHWPLRDLVPKRVTPFLAFTLGQRGRKEEERVSLGPNCRLVTAPRLGLVAGGAGESVTQTQSRD